MGSYGRVNENLDEYEDDFIDDQDGVDISGYRYADEDEMEGEEEGEDEEEEEEVEEEPVSEEALKLLKYRQKLKEQMRSKLRQENGSSSREARKPLPLNNFGSFFGPSKPVIADRVIQESKALLEARHLTPRASSSQNSEKKVSMLSSGTKNGVSRQPSNSQVKSKAQIIKQTRDYSFLLSDDVDVPKPARDLGLQRNFGQKPDARPRQVPAKSFGPPAQSSRKVHGSEQQRKPFGSPQVCSTLVAPVRKLIPDKRASVTSSDSGMQMDMRKPPLHTKQLGSGTGNGSVRPPISRPLHPQSLQSSIGKRVPTASVEKKLSAASGGDRTLSVQRRPGPSGQRMPAEKLQSSGVTKPLEHRRSVQQSSDNRILKANMAASKTQVKPPPKQSIHLSNLDRDHRKVRKPHGQLNAHKQPGDVGKGSNNRKRRAEEDDDVDFRSEIRKMFGYNPSRYRDEDDDDRMMEVGFDTIRQEEIKSARIAKREDDEEWEKIQEEERQERLRKKARMQKMSHR